MNNIKKIYIIATCTFKEIIKSKILVNTLFLGIALFIITFVAFNFTYGEPSRITIDFGLGMLSLSAIGIAIFMGSGLLVKEIENRTIYMIISRPVPRYTFLVGKIAGMVGVLIINILILSTLTLGLYFYIGGDYNSLILWAIFFTILESIIVLLLVCFLSLLVTQTVSVIVTITLYVVGHSITSAQQASFAKNMPGLSAVLDLYHFILPGFYKLNIKEFVLYQQSVSTHYLTSTVGYASMYSLFIIVLMVLVFERKNFD